MPALKSGPGPQVEFLSSRYLGDNIGVEVGQHPEMSTLKLPDRMKRIWSLEHADGWRLVVARRDHDLVILLTDNAGVVTDDVAIVGAANHYRVLHDCGGDVVPSLVLGSDCSDNATSLVAKRAWHPRRGKLVDMQGEIRCLCETY